jgi:hypothetical protein
MILCILVVTLAVIVSSVNWAFAQEARRIVPYPRGVQIETIDPVTRMPRNSFCIGVNAIDARLINNSEYRGYVSVINRDTTGRERTLYRGWLEPGTHYLSTLMRTQLELTGPAGTEMLRVDVNDYGQSVPGNWVSFYVQNCGGPTPGPGPWPPGPGYAQLWAWVYPYAIEQGKKGTVTLQTDVESRPNMTYYVEILNSWGKLWKRFPANRRPYERYQVTLPVGKTTKPGMLTYTVNLWLEQGFGGQRRNVATTRFSFRVVAPGSTPPQYDPRYPEYPGYPQYPGWQPYSGEPYFGAPSYGTTPPSWTPPYGTGYPRGLAGERHIQ